MEAIMFVTKGNYIFERVVTLVIVQLQGNQTFAERTNTKTYFCLDTW